ncbi:MAG: BlaI/MecI/CopY family transcriptional regulator [Armatimonadota bacterium]
MKKASLGEQELELLRFVTENAPIALRDVAERYGAPRGQARTTIHTMLERLRKKGYLSREQVDGVFQYSPCIEKSELLTDLVGEFMQRVLKGSLKPFTAYLAQNSDLNSEELDDLRKMVDTLDERRKGEKKDA